MNQSISQSPKNHRIGGVIDEHVAEAPIESSHARIRQQIDQMDRNSAIGESMARGISHRINIRMNQWANRPIRQPPNECLNRRINQGVIRRNNQPAWQSINARTNQPSAARITQTAEWNRESTTHRIYQYNMQLIKRRINASRNHAIHESMYESTDEGVHI